MTAFLDTKPKRSWRASIDTKPRRVAGEHQPGDNDMENIYEQNGYDARHRLVIVKPHLVAADEPASSTELTATGEQYVIPGCERNAIPRAGQMEFFG